MGRDRVGGLLVLTLLVTGCAAGDTSRLTPDQEARFAEEGVLRRGDNLIFRYTHDAGRRDQGWEDRRGSILVTRKSVLIHHGETVGLEITPRSRRVLEVEKDGPRVRLRAGSGKSRETWSFAPPDDPAGWVEDIRAVIQGSSSPANR